MKRRCIKKGNGFTVGKVYEAREDNNHYYLTDDDGDKRCRVLDDDYFEPVSDTPAKYKLKKPITGQALAADGACSDEFAAKFTAAVNEQREAERGNRGEALSDRYRLTTGGDRMTNAIASPHWEACITCQKHGENGCILPHIDLSVHLGDWITCDDYLEQAEGNDQLHCHRTDTDKPSFLGGKGEK